MTTMRVGSQPPVFKQHDTDKPGLAIIVYASGTYLSGRMQEYEHSGS